MAAPVFVREHHGQLAGSSGDLTITLTTRPAIGNLLVVKYAFAVTSSVADTDAVVTENQGNTVTARTSGLRVVGAYDLHVGIQTIQVAASSGTHTVTINPV